MSQATTPLHISIGPRVRKSPFYAATLRSIEGGLLSYVSDKNPG